MSAPNDRKDPKVQGEGDYKAARRYSKDIGDYVDENSDAEITRKAKDAERALDGSEGAELRKAEKEGESHKKG